jgi:hypothetical protein
MNNVNAIIIGTGPDRPVHGDAIADAARHDASCWSGSLTPSWLASVNKLR